MAGRLDRIRRVQILWKLWAAFGRQFAVKRSVYQLPDAPNVIRYAQLHGRRDSERFMDTAEVVKAGVQRDGCTVMLKFLAECICQPSEAALVHPDP
ncbi:MAG TPA: hypothetical protein VGI20_10035 [Rhizomicrobium sp.]|jgi:hypothetical protein